MEASGTLSRRRELPARQRPEDGVGDWLSGWGRSAPLGIRGYPPRPSPPPPLSRGAPRPVWTKRIGGCRGGGGGGAPRARGRRPHPRWGLFAAPASRVAAP